MKLNTCFLLLFAVFFGCSSDSNTADEENTPSDYKQQMRNFVIGISNSAKKANPNFAVIPQNGIELVTKNGEENGELAMDYLNAIDGNGQEDLFYGYDEDDKATPAADSNYLQSFLDISKKQGKTILVTDYCSTPANMSNSVLLNSNKNYISFAADHRELDNIPDFPLKIKNENAGVITELRQAQNFLYLINLEKYGSKSQFITAVKASNYDVLIMDLFFNGVTFSKAEIEQLKNKANGGKRMVVCYMSIGEAENYRYYWNPTWNSNAPLWLDSLNPDWPGNYKVKYWNADWQAIIYGNSNSYLEKIIAAGFDGVYLDIIDAFEFYEN
jgi:cysteinyl-tRNA synthetase, unknown class